MGLGLRLAGNARLSDKEQGKTPKWESIWFFSYIVASHPTPVIQSVGRESFNTNLALRLASLFQICWSFSFPLPMWGLHLKLSTERKNLCICLLARVYLFEPIHSIGDGLAGPSETLTVKNCPRLLFLFPLVIEKILNWELTIEKIPRSLFLKIPKTGACSKSKLLSRKEERIAMNFFGNQWFAENWREDLPEKLMSREESGQGGEGGQGGQDGEGDDERCWYLAAGSSLLRLSR